MFRGTPDWSSLPRPAIRALARDNLPIMLACKCFQSCVDEDTKLSYAFERKGARLVMRDLIDRGPRRDSLVIDLITKLDDGYDIPRWIFHEIFVKCSVHRMKHVASWMRQRFDIPVNVVADATLPDQVNLHDTIHETIRDITRANDMTMLRNVMDSGLRTIDMLRSAAKHNAIGIVKHLIERYGAWDLEFCYKYGASALVRQTAVLIDPTLGQLRDFDRYFMLRSYPLRSKNDIIAVLQKLQDTGMYIDPDECMLLAARNNSPDLCAHFAGMGATAFLDCAAVAYPNRGIIDFLLSQGVSPDDLLTSLVLRATNYNYDMACVHVAPLARKVAWNDVLVMTCQSKVFKHLVEYIVNDHGDEIDPKLALRASLSVSRNTTLACMVVAKYKHALSDGDIADMCIRHGTACKLAPLLKKQAMSVHPFVKAAVDNKAPKWFRGVLDAGASTDDIWREVTRSCGDTHPQIVDYLERMERCYRKVSLAVIRDALETSRERGDWVLHACALRVRGTMPAYQNTVPET